MELVNGYHEICVIFTKTHAMEGIKLSREERTLFLNFSRRDIAIPDGMTKEQFNYAAVGLSEKGLAYTEWKLQKLAVAGLTQKGRAYLAVNPTLRNPFPWDIIMKAATLIAAGAATAAFFIGCCWLFLFR